MYDYSPRPEGSACPDDGKACTSNVCDDNGACTHPVNPGYCLIEGECIGAGEVDPSKECMACIPESSTDDYSPQPNGSICAEGTCIAGDCVGVGLRGGCSCGAGGGETALLGLLGLMGMFRRSRRRRPLPIVVSKGGGRS